ncbi:hypothetical protein MNV49_006506 [Pseudohyphozyma bogoriensis]|nr:hypothetical protein MNV49_006506 [Pseudohyphozyma bogoriensis]
MDAKFATTLYPESIPATRDSSQPRQSRTIILAFDGTGDKFDGDNTNVVRFFETLKKGDPTQLVYYQAGIGTYTGASALRTGLSAAVDMATASGLGTHIRHGYEFLMDHYQGGDKICVLGFSRGAYTARGLAGMLHKVGLLPANNHQQVAFAYKMYKQNDEEGWILSSDFKQTFCMDVTIHFLGCWDTVASVGLLPRSVLPFAASTNPSVRHFRQALALDEHRAKFKANHWIEQLNDLSTSGAEMERRAAARADAAEISAASVHDQCTAAFGVPHHSQLTKKRIDVITKTREKAKIAVDEHLAEMTCKHESTFSSRQTKRDFETDVLECWFAGAHCDVGGGAEANNVEFQLARIPLRWMIRACFECETGILFRTESLQKYGMDVDTVWPRCVPRQPETPDYFSSSSPSSSASSLKEGKIDEHLSDFYDATANINDILKRRTWWWIIECLVPIPLVKQSKDGKWIKEYGLNMARYRSIRDERPNIHYTALIRQRERNYQMRNEVDVDAMYDLTPLPSDPIPA